MTGPAALVHIAGVHVAMNSLVRQRCAWCGTTLLDYDLANLAVPVGQEGTPGVWPVGSLVLIDGNMTVLMDQPPGEALPEGACGRLDPAVTR